MNLGFSCPGSIDQSWMPWWSSAGEHPQSLVGVLHCPNLCHHYRPLPSGRSSLCLFSQAIGWKVTWVGYIVLKVIFLWELDKLSGAKLGAIVKDNFLWYPILAESWFQVSDDQPTADGVHPCYFELPVTTKKSFLHHPKRPMVTACQW